MFGADRSMSNHSKIPRQVGVVKSSEVVVRTSISIVGTLPTYSKRAGFSIREQLIVFFYEVAR